MDSALRALNEYASRHLQLGRLSRKLNQIFGPFMLGFFVGLFLLCLYSVFELTSYQFGFHSHEKYNKDLRLSLILNIISFGMGFARAVVITSEIAVQVSRNSLILVND